MKKVNRSAMHCTTQSFALIQPGANIIRKNAILFLALITLTFTACKKEAAEVEIPEITGSSFTGDATVLNQYTGIPDQTMWELQQARAATARYRVFENAKRDGYGDINVIAPNMGYHYMKLDNLDANFDYRKPEILVYNKNEDGKFELVAVEYAIPLNLSTNAPAGFSGSLDDWNRNTSFGLWLLHAWVWKYNPSGVFNPTNPDVHVH